MACFRVDFTFSLYLYHVAVLGAYIRQQCALQEIKLCCPRVYVVTHNIMKACGGSGGVTPRICNVGITLRLSDELHASISLVSGKESHVLIGWVYPGSHDSEIFYMVRRRFSHPSPVRCLVTIPTELSLLTWCHLVFHDNSIQHNSSGADSSSPILEYLRCFGSQVFITVFTTAHHLSLS